MKGVMYLQALCRYRKQVQSDTQSSDVGVYFTTHCMGKKCGTTIEQLRAGCRPGRREWRRETRSNRAVWFITKDFIWSTETGLNNA